MLKNLKFKALIISFLLFISYFLFPISVAHALTEEIAPQPVSEGTPQLASASVDSQQTDASAPAEEIPSDTNAPDQATPTQTATTLPVNRNTNALLSELTLSTVQVIPAGNSGAAATSIPIAVPPGRKGMTPNISLTYNSNSLNGWIGVGWGLDIGAIQRNTKRGVCYTCNDYVATVNGSSSELVTRGDWGLNYYGDKTEGAFAKYQKISDTGGWVVITKDGTKYYYGTTPDSRQGNANGVFKWNLDKVEDTNGNYMTITYWKNQGEIYLDRIDYAGNTTGLNPTNYVKFYLESRTDVSPMYTSNALVKTAYRLKTIEVYGNGQLTRKYVLNYDYSSSTFRSLLTSVIQYGSDGVTSLPATTFEWNKASGFEDQGAWISGAYGNWANSSDRIRNADVNGDGRTDIVIGPDGGGNWYVMLSTGSGFSNQGAWISGAYGNWANSSDRIRNTDVNGDGRTDIVIGPSGSGNWYVMLSTGSGFSNQGAWISGAYGNWANSSDRIRNTDVNGDGRTDIVIGPSGSGNWYVMLSTGSGFSNQGAWISGAYGNWANSPDRIRNTDVNGDGRADIVIGPDGGGNWYVMLSTGSGFSNQGAWISGAYGNWANSSDRIRNADVNGDGRADIVIGPDGGGNWYVMLSTGSGFSNQGAWISGAYGELGREF